MYYNEVSLEKEEEILLFRAGVEKTDEVTPSRPRETKEYCDKLPNKRLKLSEMNQCHTGVQSVYPRRPVLPKAPEK